MDYIVLILIAIGFFFIYKKINTKDLQDNSEEVKELRDSLNKVLGKMESDNKNLRQAFIDEKGRVKETIILKGIPNTGLDEAAMEAIRKTRFRPAKQRERAVGVWISIPVNFRLK